MAVKFFIGSKGKRRNKVLLELACQLQSQLGKPVHILRLDSLNSKREDKL